MPTEDETKAYGKQTARWGAAHENARALPHLPVLGTARCGQLFWSGAHFFTPSGSGYRFIFESRGLTAVTLRCHFVPALCDKIPLTPEVITRMPMPLSVRV